MGATHSVHSALSSALFGKTRRAILALLFTRPEETFYLRQIVRAVRGGQGGVQRELQRLADAEVIVRTVRGRTAFYHANRACPVFGELKGLVVKTGGVAEVVGAAGWRTRRKPTRYGTTQPAAQATAVQATVVKRLGALRKKRNTGDHERAGSTSLREDSEVRDLARRPREDVRAWLDRMPPELL